MSFDLNKDKWNPSADPDDKKRDRMLTLFSFVTITSVGIGAGSFTWLMISDYGYPWIYVMGFTSLILVIWGIASIQKVNDWRSSGGYHRPPWPFR